MQVGDLFYSFFERDGLVLPGPCCTFPCFLEVFFIYLLGYGFTFTQITRPFERAASIVLHTLR